MLVWAGWGLLRKKMSHQPPSIHSAVHGNLGIHSFSQSHKRTLTGHNYKPGPALLQESPYCPPQLSPHLPGTSNSGGLPGLGRGRVLFLYTHFFFFKLEKIVK